MTVVSSTVFEPFSNYYAGCGLITEDPQEYGDGWLLYVAMQNGNVFAFVDEDGDWCKGELIAFIFDDNGTPEVLDDMIVSVKYAGWISDAEMENWIK